jgi:indole-3-glycerol phosphate synthase
MNVLDEIMAHKRAEIARQRTQRPLTEVRAAAESAPPPLPFVAALRRAAVRPALIAEIKRRSPSRGLLAPHFDPLRLARVYRENGATCISVLTDAHYFGGSLEDLRRIRAQEPATPLLRKDFICDPYQVFESRAAGADAVLLIAAALAPGQLCDLHALVRSLGMAGLVETHSADELAAALACSPDLIGINNRDLRTFVVSLATTERLCRDLPAHLCVVAESGITSEHDVATVAALARPGIVGVDAILVGEALVTATDVAAKVRELARRTPPARGEAASPSPAIERGVGQPTPAGSGSR